MKKVLLFLIVAVLIILSGLLIWLRYGVDQSRLQSFLSHALGPDYNVEIASARISPLERSVSIGHMTVSSTTDDRVIFRTDTLHISGIGPGLVFRRNIALSGFMMDTFTIDWDDSLLGGYDESTDDMTVRKLEIKSLDLVNGTVIVRDDGRESNRINTLNLKAGFSYEFVPEADSLVSPRRTIAIDSLGFLFSDDRYRLSLFGFDYDHQDGLLTLSLMQLTPVGGYFQYMSSLEYDDHMYEIAIRDFTASGIDPAAYRKHNLLKVGSMDVDAFRIHVAKNKQLPERPDKEDPTLINRSIQKLPFAVQFDSLSFRNTNIQYSEQDETGTRPGTISFMNSTIRIRDVNSLSPAPANLVASTYLQNHSELNTELNFTLDDGPFLLTGTGKLESFDIKQLNSIFMDLEGIEILSGYAHEIDFYLEMIDDSSSGRMHLVYEDLEMKIIDRDDHGGTPSGFIQSIIVKEALLRPENLADSNDEIRTGDIDHVREPDSPFFQHLWHSLRSGIFDIVLRM